MKSQVEQEYGTTSNTPEQQTVWHIPWMVEVESRQPLDRETIQSTHLSLDENHRLVNCSIAPGVTHGLYRVTFKHGGFGIWCDFCNDYLFRSDKKDEI